VDVVYERPPNLSLSEYYEKMQLLNSKKTTQLCI